MDDYTWERLFTTMVSRPPRPSPRQEEPPKEEEKPLSAFIREWWEPDPFFDPDYDRLDHDGDDDFDYDQVCFITVDDVSDDDDDDIEILDVPETPGEPYAAETDAVSEDEAG